MRRIWLLFFISLAGFAHAGETAYVDDKLLITLRTGKGNGYQILRTLPSGTALEVLESGEEYTRVRTPKRLEGWVLSRYLTNEPIAAQRLTRAQSQLEQSQSETEALRGKLNALRGERDRLERQRADLASRNSELKTELEKLRELAATPMRLSRENQTMKKQIGELEAELHTLTETNAALKDSSYRDWFLAGAGVLGGGILLGLLLPRLRRRRKSGWDF